MTPVRCVGSWVLRTAHPESQRYGRGGTVPQKSEVPGVEEYHTGKRFEVFPVLTVSSKRSELPGRAWSGL